MKIIIPMSGFGERFRLAGYTMPKPLIEIDGKSIIAYVIDMFPGEQDFIFICNQEHLSDPSYRMAEIIQKYCPYGRIVGIAPHKLGPIHAVRQVEYLVHPNEPVIVNYCDFSCYWDWSSFKKFLATSQCDGVIPAYKGFHPHSLGTTNYAYIREQDGWIRDIQEKTPFTNNRMQEYASSGTYYFSTGKLMSEAFRRTMDLGLSVAGEYYVSLAYKAMLERNKKIAVYPLQHFMQWGTPDDVTEYKGWSAAFRRMIVPQGPSPMATGAVIIPMAGMGQRFADEGYAYTKPLIPVSGKPMVFQAVDDLPSAQFYSFVLRSEMVGCEMIADKLQHTYKNAVIKVIYGATEGQACSALIGLDALSEENGDVPGPVTFGACDNGSLYSSRALQTLFHDPEVDVIVWGVCGHANAIRHPEMYGWIDVKNGLVNRISVKKPLSSPASDPIVLGTFTFRRSIDFRRVVERLIAKNERVNGEFYIDSCINEAIELGLKCHLFNVDSFLSWGTPNDLRTYEYWQSCFHKWDGHPYRLENDWRIPVDEVQALKSKYLATIPEM